MNSVEKLLQIKRVKIDVEAYTRLFIFVCLFVSFVCLFFIGSLFFLPLGLNFLSFVAI